MSNNYSSSKGKILTVIWLITAAAALILTVLYFDRLQDLHSAEDKQAQITEGAKKNEDRTQLAKAGDEEIRDDISGQASEPLSEETQKSGQPEENTDMNPETPGTDVEDDGTVTDGTEAAEGTESSEGTESTEGKADEETAAGKEDEATAQTERPYYYDENLDPMKPIIAMSFDDGPSKYTERILAALQANGAKATFFMVGYNIKKQADRVRMVYEAGCEIGNHTLDHTSLKEGTAEEIMARVYDNEELLNTIVPVGRVLVRPPYGSFNDLTKEVIQRPMVNWSVDSRDWETKNADKIVAQIKQDARDGYIILMHDLYEPTAEAAERIIPWLIEQGYQITTISNMYAARGEELKDGHVHRYTNPVPKTTPTPEPVAEPTPEPETSQTGTGDAE